MKKRLPLGRFAVAVAALAILATAAAAGPIHPSPKKIGFEKVDFLGSGGSVSYTGGVFGANGSISQVIALPSFNSLNVTDGSLNIQTGACDVKNCTKPNGSGQLVVGFANSGPTGISIMGLLPGMLFPQLLMSGELEHTVAVFRGDNASMKGCSASAHAKGLCGPDTGGLSAQIDASFINQTMLKDLGLLPANQSVPKQSIEQLNFDITFLGSHNNLSGTIGSINLIDVMVTTPEPGTLLLFGSSFIIAAWILRKKLATRP
jgi:hypothetical protein